MGKGRVVKEERGRWDRGFPAILQTHSYIFGKTYDVSNVSHLLMFTALSIYLSLSLYLSIYLSFFFFLSLCFSISLSIYWYISLKYI